MDTPPEVTWAVHKLSKVIPVYAYMHETPADGRISWKWTTMSAEWSCSIVRLVGPSRRLCLCLFSNSRNRYYEVQLPVDEAEAMINLMREVGALPAVAVD